MNRAERLKWCSCIVSIVMVLSAFISGIMMMVAAGNNLIFFGLITMIIGCGLAATISTACGCIADIWEKTEKNSKYLEFMYHEMSKEK